MKLLLSLLLVLACACSEEGDTFITPESPAATESPPVDPPDPGTAADNDDQDSDTDPNPPSPPDRPPQPPKPSAQRDLAGTWVRFCEDIPAQELVRYQAVDDPDDPSDQKDDQQEDDQEDPKDENQDDSQAGNQDGEPEKNEQGNQAGDHQDDGKQDDQNSDQEGDHKNGDKNGDQAGNPKGDDKHDDKDGGQHGDQDGKHPDQEPQSLAFVRSLDFKGSSVTLVDRTFSGTCDDPEARHSRLRVQFTYRVPDYKRHEINFLNARIHKVSLRFDSKNAAEAANEMEICGFSNWKVAVEKNITGKHCSEFPGKGDPLFQIFRRNSPKSLQIGEIDFENPGTTPETRPTRLDRIPFRKK